MSDPIGPYDLLDPSGRGSSTARTGGAGVFRVLARGLARRCPRCGEHDVFRRWLRIRERCPRCRLRLEREEGGFLGAMTINYAATTMLWIALLLVWLAVDLPDIRVVPLMIASLALVGVFPLFFFPFSKTIWAALDYLVYRSDPSYASREAADRATGNGHRARP